MQSKTIKLVMLAFLFVSVCTLALNVKRVKAAEPALINILSTLGFTNIEETTQTTFPPGTYVVTLYAEFAAYHAQNELSRYNVGTSNFVVLFEKSEGGFGYLTTPITKTFVADCEFGLSFLSPEARYFTQHERNPDYPTVPKHAMIFKNKDDPNMFLIGFENLLWGGDKDYQDMVISLRRESTPTVPEFGFETPIVVSLTALTYLALRKRIFKKEF